MELSIKPPQGGAGSISSYLCKFTSFIPRHGIKDSIVLPKDVLYTLQVSDSPGRLIENSMIIFSLKVSKCYCPVCPSIDAAPAQAERLR